jgi:hypothetical protein
MSNLNIGLYAEGYMYPSTAPSSQPVSTTITQIQQSGFTTAILGLFHIGRDYAITPAQIMGDIYFNETLVVSQGSYVGDPTWLGLLAGMIGGTVTQVCASIGGGGVMDYETIQKIYEGNGYSFTGTNLMKNFQRLRNEFPAISVIDMDCEETYDQASFVAFCQMLSGMGFSITFCPYTNQRFWIGSLATLNTSNPGAIKWWNLQCYDGGHGNDPGAWATEIAQAIPGFSTNGYILAGDWTDDSPSAVQSLMEGFKGEAAVGGGFIWTLDQIIQQDPADPTAVMKTYAAAISGGLGNKP